MPGSVRITVGGSRPDTPGEGFNVDIATALANPHAPSTMRVMEIGDEEVKIARSDAVALVGVLAVIEGHGRVGDLAPAAAAHLQRRLADDLGADASTALGDLLTAINQRLRRALGEPT